MTIDELKHICDMTVELTRLRQNETKHLIKENFAPELLGKLLREFNISENKNADLCEPTGFRPYRDMRMISTAMETPNL
jgi:hypothetical protein